MQFFDDPRRLKSEDLALFAELSNDPQMYAQAAALEEGVASEVPESKPRTRRALAISAISLWVRAEKPEESLRCAQRFFPSIEGMEELHKLLER